MKISLNIQSYKRAGEVESISFLPYCNLWVHEFEVEEYKKYYKNVKVLPDSLRGNLPKVKNHILDHERDNDVVVLMDDDIKYMGYWEYPKALKIEKEEFISFIEKYSLLAEELGAKLWGVNVNSDKQVYREYSPFSTLSYVSSSFSCFLKGNTLRYDERFPLKEDYDMFIQQVNVNRMVLRINKFFYEKKGAENVGGCATYRNIDREIEQLKLLQKKWGGDIVKLDSLNSSRSHKSKKKRKFDINPVVILPVSGI